MTIQIANNNWFTTALSASIGASDTIMYIDDLTEFSAYNTNATKFTYLTLISGSFREIVKATHTAGNLYLTITRAQQDTTARTWSNGTSVLGLINSGVLDPMFQDASIFSDYPAPIMTMGTNRFDSTYDNPLRFQHSVGTIYVGAGDPISPSFLNSSRAVESGIKLIRDSSIDPVCQVFADYIVVVDEEDKTDNVAVFKGSLIYRAETGINLVYYYKSRFVSDGWYDISASEMTNGMSATYVDGDTDWVSTSPVKLAFNTGQYLSPKLFTDGHTVNALFDFQLRYVQHGTR